MHIVIIIPAYNEEHRISHTLAQYITYFLPRGVVEHNTYTFLIALNGCTDGTAHVVKKIQAAYPCVTMIESPVAGKGLALRHAFMEALAMNAHIIGFVDADQSTRPDYFHQLLEQAYEVDAAIASRYMPESIVTPTRPWYKQWGRKVIYNPLVGLLFGMDYYDYQCGAKILSASLVRAVLPHLTVNQWAFDIELLYEIKRAGGVVKEVPTVWYDREGSKFASVRHGLEMIKVLFQLWWDKCIQKK